MTDEVEKLREMNRIAIQHHGLVVEELRRQLFYLNRENRFLRKILKSELDIDLSDGADAVAHKGEQW